MQSVCRLCLGIVVSGKVAFDIDEENGLIKNVNSLREMLCFCAPELDIYISQPPVKICENCLPTLVSAYNFKVKCMNTENTIRSYIQKNHIADGSVINLRSVSLQLGTLFRAGDATAGVIRHCAPQKKLRSIIDQQVLSQLRKPSTPLISGNRVILPAQTPPTATRTSKKRLSLPRQAKEKDQEIQLVGSAKAKEAAVPRPSAPGQLRQDRRMAYLGLKRKSPEKGTVEENPSPAKRSSLNNNESPEKVIVLDDDQPAAEPPPPTQQLTKFILSEGFSLNTVNKTQPPSSGKPGEQIVRRLNEVTITRKVNQDEVLHMNFNEESTEICQIDSSSDEESEVEIIEPNHPMINLVEEIPDDTSKNNTTKNTTENKPENTTKKNSILAGYLDRQKNDKVKPPKSKEIDKESTIDKTVNKEKKNEQKINENTKSQEKNITATKTASPPPPEKPKENPLKLLKAQYEHLFVENPEFEECFKKELVVNITKMAKNELKSRKFMAKIPKSRLYGCKYCSFGSLSRTAATEHFLQKHKLRGFYFCKYCDYRSKNLSELGEHANKVHMPEMVKYLQENSKDMFYICTLCDYRGGNLLDLRHHRQKKHFQRLSNGQVTCPYKCPNYWNTRAMMHKHIEEMHERELQEENYVFHCHICKFEINSKGILARHLQAHKKSELLRCLLCPFSTKSQKLIDKHREKHLATHSQEDMDTACGMVYVEGNATKNKYNDDYRITLDSLRHETQRSYRNVKPTSTSSDFLDGPSLSEMLLVGLSENFDYVDLVENPQDETPIVPEIENEDVTVIEDEDYHVENEVPTSTSDETKKVEEKSKNLVKNPFAINRETIPLLEKVDDTASTSKQSDEECTSTTNHTEDVVSMEINDESIEDTPEIVDKESEDNIEKDTTYKENTNNDMETRETSSEETKTMDTSEENIKDVVDSGFDKEGAHVDNEPLDQLNTSSTLSEDSNVSDLTKNVNELEDSIRELNSVLGGGPSTKVLDKIKPKQSQENDSVNTESSKVDIIDDLEIALKDLAGSEENGEKIKQNDNEIDVTSKSEALDECPDTDKQNKTDEISENDNKIDDDKATSESKELIDCKDTERTNTETTEDGFKKIIDESNEELESPDTETLNHIAEKTIDSSEKLTKSTNITAAIDDKILEDIDATTHLKTSQQDKRSALEKRLFGAGAKKITALEERFFKRS